MRHLALYMDHLRAIRTLDEVSAQKRERHILRIQAALGRSLLEVDRASDLNAAIVKAALQKKSDFNGGHQDDGANLRHRLGMAAVCYLRWAHGEGFIQRNPYPKNPFRRPALQDAYYLDDEKIERLMEFSASLSLRDKLIIYLLLDTGMRVSELCRVKVGDIDFLERTIFVQMKKVDRKKTPPFSETTAELLTLWLKVHTSRSDFLFPTRVGLRLSPITTKAVRAQFARFSKEVGFRINPHALRHTAVSAWVDKAGQIPAMQFAGHVTPAMTNHYTHMNKTKLRQTGDGIFVTKNN